MPNSAIKHPPPQLPEAVAGLRLLWPEHVAELTGVPVGTLHQWRHRGKGPLSIKVGRHVRYRAADVAGWLAAGADDKEV